MGINCKFSLIVFLYLNIKVGNLRKIFINVPEECIRMSTGYLHLCKMGRKFSYNSNLVIGPVRASDIALYNLIYHGGVGY